MAIPRWLPRAIVAASFAAYTAYWSCITVLKYFALNAYVFDLGIFMQNGWVVLHQLHTPEAFLQYLAYNGIVYVASPLTLLDSYPAVLIFQSAFIGLAAFPLYGIARRALRADLPAALIAVSYLIYFPLAGVNWYDAHYQALFPTLFILGYYFYARGRMAPAAALFILSAMVRFPYALFPLLFSLMVLGEELVRGARGRGVDAGKLRFAVAVASFSLLMSVLWYALVMGRSVVLQGPFVGAVLSSVRGASYQSPTVDLGTKLLTLALFLEPVLFTTLLSRRWLPFLVPYAYLLFATGTTIYRYPYVFVLQYPAGVVPFVYLGAVEGIALLSRGRPRRAALIAAAVLVSTAAFAVAYQPYGPLNGSAPISFQLDTQTAANMTVYNEFSRIVSLIPHDDPYVLFQDNMPDLLPRPLPYVPPSVPFNQFPLLPSSVSTDLYYGRLPNGTQVPARIDYVVADPYSPQFTAVYGAPPYNASMQYLFDKLYATGEYGVLAEASGMIALARNYSGPPEYFVPIVAHYVPGDSPGNLYAGEPGFERGQVIEASNVSSQMVWYGPYSVLAPGLYNVTFMLYTTNSSPGNALQLQLTADSGGVYLGTYTLTGDELRAGEWTPVTLTFYSNDIYTGVEFRGYALRWVGNLSVRSVDLVQVAPALSSSRDFYVMPWQMGRAPGAELIGYKLIEASNASNEIVWYGPYATLQPGYYNVTFIMGAGNQSPFDGAQLQVTSDYGKYYLATIGITGQYMAGREEVSLPVYVNSTRNGVEFRCAAQEWNGTIYLYGIRVIREGGAPPQSVTTVYPASQMWIPASGVSRYVDGLIVSNVSSGTLWYGPYATLYPGHYNVTFLVRGEATGGELALQATSDYGKYYLATSTVAGSSLSPSSWTPVTLSFDVNSTQQFVEFRGFAMGWNGSVELANVTVEWSPG
jgi:uncharacterized membrane protein